MALKNRDGSVYSLNKPNILMHDQTLWARREKFTMHNAFGQITTWQDRVIEEPKISEPEEEIKIVETRPEPKPEEKKEQNKTPTIQVWCLPGRLEETVDPLYNEKYGKMIYGNKFLFDAIIENQSDVQLSLWTNNAIITEGSVVFPRTNDKRWWRVYSASSVENGVYSIKASITDYHPNFS